MARVKNADNYDAKVRAAINNDAKVRAARDIEFLQRLADDDLPIGWDVQPETNKRALRNGSTKKKTEPPSKKRMVDKAKKSATVEDPAVEDQPNAFVGYNKRRINKPNTIHEPAAPKWKGYCVEGCECDLCREQARVTLHRTEQDAAITGGAPRKRMAPTRCVPRPCWPPLIVLILACHTTLTTQSVWQLHRRTWRHHHHQDNHQDAAQAAIQASSQTGASQTDATQGATKGQRRLS